MDAMVTALNIFIYLGLLSLAFAVFKAIAINPVIDVLEQISNELKKLNTNKP